jgi:hypothetical protein
MIFLDLSVQDLEIKVVVKWYYATKKKRELKKVKGMTKMSVLLICMHMLYRKHKLTLALHLAYDHLILCNIAYLFIVA